MTMFELAACLGGVAGIFIGSAIGSRIAGVPGAIAGAVAGLVGGCISGFGFVDASFTLSIFGEQIRKRRALRPHFGRCSASRTARSPSFWVMGTRQSKIGL